MTDLSESGSRSPGSSTLHPICVIESDVDYKPGEVLIQKQPKRKRVGRLSSKRDLTEEAALEDAVLALRHFKVPEEILLDFLKRLQIIPTAIRFEFSSVSDTHLALLHIDVPGDDGPAWVMESEKDHGFILEKLPAMHHAFCDLVRAYYGMASEALCRTLVDIMILAAVRRLKTVKIYGEIALEIKGTTSSGEPICGRGITDYVADEIEACRELDAPTKSHFVVLAVKSRELFMGGWAQAWRQLVTQVYAAFQVNQDGQPVFGVLSDGVVWKFIKYDGSAWHRSRQYSVGDDGRDRIFSCVLHVLRQASRNGQSHFANQASSSVGTTPSSVLEELPLETIFSHAPSQKSLLNLPPETRVASLEYSVLSHCQASLTEMSDQLEELCTGLKRDGELKDDLEKVRKDAVAMRDSTENVLKKLRTTKS